MSYISCSWRPGKALGMGLCKCGTQVRVGCGSGISFPTTLHFLCLIHFHMGLSESQSFDSWALRNFRRDFELSCGF